jgi:8-oxo-dGTP diphosphatase
MEHYDVVAAVIEYDGKYLCMQRGKTKYEYTSFKYEFPGGKIEKGETPQQALKRELEEEMAYEVNIERSLVTVEQTYPDFAITMEAFLCHATSPHFTLKEHKDYKWLPMNKMNDLDWAAADIKVLGYLLKL